LPDIVAAHKRGAPVGIYSICSTHPFVLETCVQQALEDGSPLLVESTCNQVNQEGGYTRMKPADFRDYLYGIADRFDFPRERLILGGDHLGPSPWQDKSVESAMAKARDLVRDCVLAGYAKIHLDASMKCADDPVDVPLDKTASADRAAELCLTAEEAYAAASPSQPPPCYVIGTEVPPPGGAQQRENTLAVTTVEDARETIELTRKAFKRRGLGEAWERVVALVVQPGVEFGDDFVSEYDHRVAARLSRFIATQDQIVFEAHSTDYQTRDALRALIEDHFAVLKVGPATTFAFREAVFALGLMEAEWFAGREEIELSNIQRVLDDAMVEDPSPWEKYYTGSESTMRFARKYSYSDRSRYYWPNPGVQKALTRLLHNLEHPVSPTLLSQFLPAQYERVREGVLENTPRGLIYDKIRSVVADYAHACGCTGMLPHE
jgi:D-tagatose-1,6-bisphosphate aldolase subunit GatZ/KbaZ